MIPLAASPALGAANGGPGAFSTTTEDGSIPELADDAMLEASDDASPEKSPVLARRGRQHADPIAAPNGIGRAQHGRGVELAEVLDEGIPLLVPPGGPMRSRTGRSSRRRNPPSRKLPIKRGDSLAPNRRLISHAKYRHLTAIPKVEIERLGTCHCRAVES